jgi:ribosomal small subunit protein bTHX
MGKGDKKTKRGKINRGTYGVRRPRKKSKPAYVATKPKKKVEAPKKAVAEKAKAKPKATAKKTTAKKATTKKAAAKKPAAKPKK